MSAARIRETKRDRSIMSSFPDTPAQTPAWHAPDAETRLQAIERLTADHEPDQLPTNLQKELADTAIGDEDRRVRAAAARSVSDPELLDAVCRHTKQRDKTVYRHCKQRLEDMARERAERERRQQEAEQCCLRLEQLAKSAPGPLTGARLEYLQKQWAGLEDIADSDLKQRFSDAVEQARQQVAEFEQSRARELAHAEQNHELEAVLRETRELIHGLPSPAGDSERQALDQYGESLDRVLARCSEGASEALVSEARDLLARIRDYRRKHDQARQMAASVTELEEQVTAATPKESDKLRSLRQNFEQLTLPGDWPEHFPDDPVVEAYRRIGSRLDTLERENDAWQQEQVARIENHIAELDRAIEEGHVSHVQSLWDRSHNAIGRLAEERRQPLQEKLQIIRPRIKELMDWKRFAAGEKKRELIEHMRQLHDLTMHPPEKARKIRRLQDEWRNLGPAEDNDRLWKEFSELASAAFEPCKEYFRQRKELMRFNRRERGKICEQLETYADALDSGESEVDISRINQVEKKAREEWKQYAPIEHKRVAELQKRFNAALKRLRQHRGKALQEHAERKQELVDKARELTELDNLDQAISQVKQLQEQWKTIGPAHFKQERALWNAFRESCDTIFGRRDARNKEKRQVDDEALGQARQYIDRLTELLEQSDEDFVEAKPEINRLRRQFREALPQRPTSQSRSLQQQFRQLSDRIDGRLRATPDREHLQLRRQVQACAEFCARHETALLDSGASGQSSEALHAQWRELELPADETLAQRLQERFDRLIQINDGELEPAAASEEAGRSARELCVDMEILAGIDSPASDKSLRMEKQLNQLKHGLGQHSRSPRQLARQLRELALHFTCLGPLQPSERTELEQRIDKVLDTL